MILKLLSSLSDSNSNPMILISPSLPPHFPRALPSLLLSLHLPLLLPWRKGDKNGLKESAPEYMLPCPISASLK